MTLALGFTYDDSEAIILAGLNLIGTIIGNSSDSRIGSAIIDLGVAITTYAGTFFSFC